MKRKYGIPVFIGKKEQTNHYDKNDNLVGRSMVKKTSALKVILYLFTFLGLPAMILYVIKGMFALPYNLYVLILNNKGE